MYKLSIKPDVLVYVAENKTLAGKEDRVYEGEAIGRKLSITFFESAGGDLVQRVNRDSLSLVPQLLTIAEILQTLGVTLPPDPERTAQMSEVLLEAHYENIDIERLEMNLETGAPQVHIYSLNNGVSAEAAFIVGLAPAHRTKMALARLLESNEALLDGETLHSAWALPLATLQGRAAPYLPAPLVPPPAGAVGRGGPRGGRARGRGDGRGRGAPPGPPAPPALAIPPGPRGRGRGRGG